MPETEHRFKLPIGYKDDAGNIHMSGKMRLATAADEILPHKDPRVKENLAYLSIILLSRVLTKLGNLNEGDITPGVIERLYATDLRYLQEFYENINVSGTFLKTKNGSGTLMLKTKCPDCGHNFEVNIGSGE
ncbi:hypothetical protein [Methanobacterium ferruginis]|uniref:hypothetical protein n=1 Tax=Methanobacterium ferruginis TaxID=710191 RepID=UPI00257467C0|nr:hypothetical protein [Methanobacterium ferruginis]BDZ68390.1 hypothetical protein GCM10025860_18380 [Methanobacterium ferruginis]